MIKRFDVSGKTMTSALSVVALLIAADGYIKKDGNQMTADEIWNSNSHGELFGVIGAMQLCMDVINEIADKLPKGLDSAIDYAINNNIVLDVGNDGIWRTGVGRACAQNIWSNIP